MAHRCDISQLDKQFGNRVSHANNATKHAFKGNIQVKRIFVPELGRYIKLKLSTRILRTIDKLGLSGTLKKYGLTLKQVM